MKRKYMWASRDRIRGRPSVFIHLRESKPERMETSDAGCNGDWIWMSKDDNYIGALRAALVEGLDGFPTTEARRVRVGAFQVDESGAILKNRVKEEAVCQRQEAPPPARKKKKRVLRRFASGSRSKGELSPASSPSSRIRAKKRRSTST